MTAKLSAGLILYRLRDGAPLVLLVHPGGPYYAKRDAGAWSIPKGECGAGEEPLGAALREFEEETGTRPDGIPVPLGAIVQAGGKRVVAFALLGDLAAEAVRSNHFELEWPPRSGRRQSFPEIDRAGWFTLAEARRKLLPSQLPFLDRLAERLATDRSGQPQTA